MAQVEESSTRMHTSCIVAFTICALINKSKELKAALKALKETAEGDRCRRLLKETAEGDYYRTLLKKPVLFRWFAGGFQHCRTRCLTMDLRQFQCCRIFRDRESQLEVLYWECSTGVFLIGILYQSLC